MRCLVIDSFYPVYVTVLKGSERRLYTSQENKWRFLNVPNW